ncbi:CPBP family intramembrane glutamic endopeptidase [Bacillus sp. Marseille-P3661]|uniref:CPBP family intramembrane glutamic endopeptidase n=1 Tax=Bacillus sp. Marseille-P3661 TaxID=1936234 RepID=UPI0015E16399|nr:type II CAAX endopeptidase family protein [Bacillus sp. Marseille-P3661]
MKNMHLLLVPTIMIYVGLQLLSNIFITFLLFYCWLLIVPLLEKKKTKFILLGSIRGDSKNIFSVGILSGLLSLSFVFGGLLLLHPSIIDVDHIQSILDEWGFTGRAVIGLIIILLVVNPILEEVYWRSFMYQKLKAGMKAIYANLITSFFYTLYHLLIVIPIFQMPLRAIAVISVFLAGIFWGYLREKTNSIIGSIISHLLADLGIICAYWFIIR